MTKVAFCTVKRSLTCMPTLASMQARTEDRAATGLQVEKCFHVVAFLQTGDWGALGRQVLSRQVSGGGGGGLFRSQCFQSVLYLQSESPFMKPFFDEKVRKSQIRRKKYNIDGKDDGSILFDVVHWVLYLFMFLYPHSERHNDHVVGFEIHLSTFRGRSLPAGGHC